MFDERLQVGPRRSVLHTQRITDGRREQRGIAQRCQRDERNGTVEALRHLQRQAGLADASRPDEGDQPVTAIAHQRQELIEARAVVHERIEREGRTRPGSDGRRCIGGLDVRAGLPFEREPAPHHRGRGHRPDATAVWSRGRALTPRSRSLIARVLTNARAASSSWLSPAWRRWRRSIAPNVASPATVGSVNPPRRAPRDALPRRRREGDIGVVVVELRRPGVWIQLSGVGVRAAPDLTSLATAELALDHPRQPQGGHAGQTGPPADRPGDRQRSCARADEQHEAEEHRQGSVQPR